ncbi:MAG: nitrate- and nitrite sensing domain-containing protein [Trebonia sp.]
MDQRSGTMTTAALGAGGRPRALPPGPVPEKEEQRPDEAVHSLSRFQLRNWRVRWRIGVLVIIPTVAAIVLGGFRVEGARETAAVFARVNQLTTLGSDVTALTQSVEDERDLTAGVVAARQSGNTTLAATLSRELNGQYATTNGGAAVVENASGQIDSSYPAVARTDLSAVVSQLGTLSSLRALPQTGMTSLPIIADYTILVSVLLAFDNDLAAGSSSPQLAQTVGSLDDVAQMADQASQQRAILFAELIGGQFGIGGLQALINAQAAQSSDLSAFQGIGQNLPAYTPHSGLSPTLTEVQQFSNIVAGPGIDAAQAIGQNALISGDNGQPPIQPNGGPQAWFGDMTNELSTIRAAESDFLASGGAQATSLQQSSQSSERLTAIVVLILLALVLAITILIARSMIVPLRRLRADALDVAGRRLPEIVRRLSESQDADNDVKIELIGINSADEIGEVARAFDQVHREAVRLAGDEALLRANLNAMFVNLSRRSQTLIERQLGIIDRLEQSEQDSDRLSSLFRLDHLATRMRRNSENLLVLAGHEAPRKWSQPVPLVDILRASVSEIEKYERISLSVQPGVMVTGRVASDVVHLVAELVENATVFSPEDTQVLITSQRLASGGVLLNITDAGLGVPDQDLSYANWRLDNPPVVDVAVSRRMGLFVVGRLAARHGIRVRLQHARAGGLTALVWLPETVAEGEDTPSLGQPRRGLDADRRKSNTDAYSTVDTSNAADRYNAGDGMMADAMAASPRRSVVRAQTTGSAWPPASQARETLPGPVPKQVTSSPVPVQPLRPAQPPVPAQPAVATPEPAFTSGETGARLPIFDSVESDWFRRGGMPLSREAGSTPSPTGPAWTSPADDGFRAAQAASSPATGEVTTAGLPKRVPSANLVPGKVGRDQAPRTGVRQPAASPAPRTAEEVRKTADEVRNRMTGLQRGAREGRAAAPVNYQTDEN